VLGRIGGDAALSDRGFDFSDELCDFMLSASGPAKFKVWSSCLLRAVETVHPIISKCRQLGDKSPLLKAHRIRALNELYAGSCEGMTYQQIKTTLPDEFRAREKNKLHYRYPNGGESYVDLIERLRPIIIECERETSDVLIVAHNAVVRTIIGYFTDATSEELPFIEVPLHQIICLEPTPFGCNVKHFNLDSQLGNSLDYRS
jgi:broad specificity phosphatase PhoE